MWERYSRQKKQGKGPEVGVCLVCSRISKEAGVTGAEGVVGRIRGERGQRIAWHRPWMALVFPLRWEPWEVLRRGQEGPLWLYAENGQWGGNGRHRESREEVGMNSPGRSLPRDLE